jgi:hypothetical protein
MITEERLNQVYSKLSQYVNIQTASLNKCGCISECHVNEFFKVFKRQSIPYKLSYKMNLYVAQLIYLIYIFLLKDVSL